MSGAFSHAATASNQEKKDQPVNSQADLPIVDTHEHLWDLTKFNLPWTKDNKVLGRSFVTKDYLAATQGLNLVKSVYMEVDVDPKQQVQEAEYVIDLCQRKDNPMVGAVISGRPATDEFRAYIMKYKDSQHIKGVRQVLHGPDNPPGFCLGSQFVKSVQLLGELGMNFDLCLRSDDLGDGAKLVAQCPKTRFVVDHCGNMDVTVTDKKKRQVWMDAMQALAQHDNVVCKISGIIVTANENWKTSDLEPNMRFSMETFGPDRRMFAGDWPVCTLRASFRQWVDALKEIVRGMNMTLADQKKLFHDNAVRFYGLKDKGYKPA
ncbi:MAG: amidohydrolase family protein [Planctomycetia bacterium]|nr:amidohydrolase family protein [Planctomycetia bacterium]